MGAWLLIVAFSIVAGALCAGIKRRSYSFLAAGFVPWFSLLAALLVEAYVLPYQGGGASMWPIAQIFGGTAAVLIGVCSCAVVRHFMGRKNA